MFTACGIMHRRSCLLVALSIAPEDGRNYRPKHVDLIEVTNTLLMLRLVGYFYYCKSLLFYESCVTNENWRRFLSVRTKNVLFG